MSEYQHLLEHCVTDAQEEKIRALIEHGNPTAAGKALGCSEKTIRKARDACTKRATMTASGPYFGPSSELPPPLRLKGVSTLTEDAQGRPQWIKASVDELLYRKNMEEATAAFFEDLPQIADTAPAPEDFHKDVIPWVQIGDAHFGMLAHEAETGQSFDLKIAESELCAAFKMLIDDAPHCERIVINDLGDATHYETFEAITMASGHTLDFDTRYPKMIRVWSRTMRFLIDYALSKSKYVDVIVNQGNHSRSNDVWMAELLRVAYGETGRVSVLNNDCVFIPYRMGNTFVMVHHSDKCKPKQLAEVMATDYREHWGQTEYHYVDIGHIHHSMVLKEHPGCKVESWNQLAAPDKYAFEHGYRSRQSMSIVYRSKTYGEVGRRVVPVEQVRDMLRAKTPNAPRSAVNRKVFVV